MSAATRSFSELADIGLGGRWVQEGPKVCGPGGRMALDGAALKDWLPYEKMGRRSRPGRS